MVGYSGVAIILRCFIANQRRTMYSLKFITFLNVGVANVVERVMTNIREGKQIISTNLIYW